MLSEKDQEIMSNAQVAHTNNSASGIPKGGVNLTCVVGRYGGKTEYAHRYSVTVTSDPRYNNIGKKTAKDAGTAREGDFFENGIEFETRTKNCKAVAVSIGQFCTVNVGSSKETTSPELKPGTVVTLYNLNAQRTERNGSAAVFWNASGMIPVGTVGTKPPRQIGGNDLLAYALKAKLVPEHFPPFEEKYRKNADENGGYMTASPGMLIPVGSGFQEIMKQNGIHWNIIRNPNEPVKYKYEAAGENGKKEAVLNMTMHGVDGDGEDALRFKLALSYYSESFRLFGVSQTVPQGYALLWQFFLPVLKDMNHVILANCNVRNGAKMEENGRDYVQLMLKVSESSDDDDDDDEEEKKEAEAAEAAAVKARLEKEKKSYKFGQSFVAVAVYFNYDDMLKNFFLPVTSSFVEAETLKGHIKGAMSSENKKDADEITDSTYRETGAVVMNFQTDRAKSTLKKALKAAKNNKKSSVGFFASSSKMVEILGSSGLRRLLDMCENLTPEDGDSIFKYLTTHSDNGITEAAKPVVEYLKTTRMAEMENKVMAQSIVMVAYKPQEKCDPATYLRKCYFSPPDFDHGEEKPVQEDEPDAKKVKTDN